MYSPSPQAPTNLTVVENQECVRSFNPEPAATPRQTVLAIGRPFFMVVPDSGLNDADGEIVACRRFGMIHAYHVIWGAYGFWLPNDPRGSWSDFVASWELARFGKSTKSIERSDVDVKEWDTWRSAAITALKYPPVQFTGVQARAAATGFGNAVCKSRYTIWACSILPEHVHLVIARHTYEVEQICNLLKGEATKQLKAESLHPQAAYADEDGKLPSTWAEKEWKVYLDSEAAIETAIQYVEDNPEKENKPRQKWSFVTPFAGLDKAGWITYH
jgi:REP element-mobilizing transposase RayT